MLNNSSNFAQFSGGTNEPRHYKCLQVKYTILGKQIS